MRENGLGQRYLKVYKKIKRVQGVDTGCTELKDRVRETLFKNKQTNKPRMHCNQNMQDSDWAVKKELQKSKWKDKPVWKSFAAQKARTEAKK